MRRANGGAVFARTQTKVFKPGLHHAPCGPIGTEGGRCEARALRHATYAVMLRALGHWKTTVRRTPPQAAGCSLLGPGDNAVVFPRPGQTEGPSSEERHRVSAAGIPPKIQLV